VSQDRYRAEHRDGRTVEARTLDALILLMLEQWGAAGDREGLQPQLEEGGDGVALIADDDAPDDVIVTVYDREHVSG
jgi:hypothetical protein